jgi:hypothetical protein
MSLRRNEKLRQDRNARVKALIREVGGRVSTRQREREMRHAAADEESWSWGKLPRRACHSLWMGPDMRVYIEK